MQKDSEDGTPQAWEHFAHQADIGVRGRGDSKSEAFAHAAVAMTAVIVDPESVHPLESVDIECDCPDDELLLVDWLNALVYEMATRKMLFHSFEVEIDGRRLHARAKGEKVDVERHQPAVEVKGATYTGVSVRREPDGRWMAQCVVDV